MDCGLTPRRRGSDRSPRARCVTAAPAVPEAARRKLWRLCSSRQRDETAGHPWVLSGLYPVGNYRKRWFSTGYIFAILGQLQGVGAAPLLTPTAFQPCPPSPASSSGRSWSLSPPSAGYWNHGSIASGAGTKQASPKPLSPASSKSPATRCAKYCSILKEFLHRNNYGCSSAQHCGAPAVLQHPEAWSILVTQGSTHEPYPAPCAAQAPAHLYHPRARHSSAAHPALHHSRPLHKQPRCLLT